MTPIETLLGWLEGLDKEPREELAFLVSGLVPQDFIKGETNEDDEDPDVPYRAKRLRERAERWVAGSKLANVGVTLMLAGWLDYSLSGRGTSEDWTQIESRFKAILEAAPNNPDKFPPGVVEHSKRSLADLPRRSAMWIAVSESWKNLRDGALSNQAMSDWLILAR